MEVIDYPNYLIYDDGRVYNKNRNRFLKPCPNSLGYYRVCLCENNERKTCKIHRLVAIHYIPNPENKREVDHINRIRTDNRIENLRWATSSENNQNKGISKNNTTGVKNISYSIPRDYWVFHKTINGKRIEKYFKTKEEAIEFKNQFDLT
tara:strand:- start:132 stop:581 length:450 start_codon:yes stop_codon:yes gene_type:complete